MKAAFFLGRIHHAYKLLPVASALEQSGYEIEFLVCDNSINIDPATEYLPKFNIVKFHHARDFITTYDSVNAMSDKLMHFAVSDLTKYIPPFWVASAIREAAIDYQGFSNYLDASEPDLVFALHEQNFFVKILFYLAQTKNIQTYSLMEGMVLEREESDLGKYSSATEYTDALFSWSEYDKNFYADPDKIVPVGPTHLDEWLQMRRDMKMLTSAKAYLRKKVEWNYGDTVITFAPPRLDLYRGDFLKAATALAEWSRNRGMKLVVKLHPFQGDDAVTMVSNSLSRYNHVIVSNDDDSIQFLVMSDVVITQTSTISLEAIALGIPLIEIDLDYIGLEQSLSSEGAATLLEGEDLDKIAAVLTGDGDDTRVEEFIEKRLSLADGDSTSRIVGYINAMRQV